jgi:hypothetical protein
LGSLRTDDAAEAAVVDAGGMPVGRDAGHRGPMDRLAVLFSRRRISAAGLTRTRSGEADERI